MSCITDKWFYSRRKTGRTPCGNCRLACIIEIPFCEFIFDNCGILAKCDTIL